MQEEWDTEEVRCLSQVFASCQLYNWTSPNGQHQAEFSLGEGIRKNQKMRTHKGRLAGTEGRRAENRKRRLMSAFRERKEEIVEGNEIPPTNSCGFLACNYNFHAEIVNLDLCLISLVLKSVLQFYNLQSNTQLFESQLSLVLEEMQYIMGP